MSYVMQRYSSAAMTLWRFSYPLFLHSGLSSPSNTQYQIVTSKINSKRNHVSFKRGKEDNRSFNKKNKNKKMCDVAREIPSFFFFFPQTWKLNPELPRLMPELEAYTSTSLFPCQEHLHPHKKKLA